MISKIVHELCVFFFECVGHAQYGRRMYCRDKFLGPAVRKKLRAAGGNSKIAAHQRLRRRRSQTHDQLRLNGVQLRFEPRPACRNFHPTRLGMDAPLAALGKFEVFHGVRDVDLFAIEPGFLHRFIQQPPGRPDERMSLAILFVAGHFADHHDSGIRRSFAEHDLRGVPVQVAAAALGRGRLKQRQFMRRRNPRSGGSFLIFCHIDHPGIRFRQKLRNNLRFGQRGPVPHRHLGLHRFYFDARGIENGAVVIAPKVFEGVIVRRLRTWDTGRIRDLFAIPMRASVGSEDRPAHAGETFREPWRHGFHNVMVRLVPGGKLLRIGIGYPPETHEGLHLVHVPANGFLKEMELPDVIIDFDFKKIVLAMRDAIQDPVEQCPASGIAVQGGRLREF